VNEQDIIFKSISDLETALPSKFNVRTPGGDASGSPPLCILRFEATRINENGINPLADVLRDNSGNAIGMEFHRYHRAELDIEIRTYDESERDLLLSDVMDAFLPYEYDSSGFHKDTTEWEIGSPSPRSNPVVEPDWYEGGLTIRFTYVSRVEQTADPLTSIQDGSSGGVYVDETLDEDRL
jgi:hypothetical protein